MSMDVRRSEVKHLRRTTVSVPILPFHAASRISGKGALSRKVDRPPLYALGRLDL